MLSPLTWMLLGLGLFLLGCVALWLIYVPKVVRLLGQSPLLLPDYYPPLVGGQECEIPTSDGLRLRGTYLPTLAHERLGVIAFCHELGSDRSGAMHYLADLREQGFDIFAFDFRNHGESDSVAGYKPLPWLTGYEVEDVQAAVDYLLARPDADPAGIGLFGVSKGGAAALCVAARDERVRAVVTDGAFDNASIQDFYFRRYVRIYIKSDSIRKRFPAIGINVMHRWARLVLGIKLGCRLVSVGNLARRVRQPVLMVHGQCDSMIPLEVARNLRNALAGPRRLWVVPRAKHNMASVVATREYHHRTSRFFLRQLAPGRVPRPVRRRVEGVKSWLSQAVPLAFSGQTGSIPAPRHTPAHSTVETR